MDKAETKLNRTYITYGLATLTILLFFGAIWFVFAPPATSGNLQWEQRNGDFWELKTYDRQFWHSGAKKYCQQLKAENHYDWRLPTLTELQALLTITAGSRRNIAWIERAIYWTSTSYNGGKHRFWAISFLSDEAAPMEVHNYNSVVCVRTINKTMVD